MMPSGQQIVLRPLRSGDSSLLSKYFETLSENTCRLFAPHEFTKEQAEILCSNSDGKNIIPLIGVTGDISYEQIVSYFIIGVGLGEADSKRYMDYGMHLDSVCTIAPSVADSFQNKGLGSLVMEKALMAIRNIGRTQVVLQGGVQALNTRAIHFYKKFGFRVVGAFSTNVENYDMILDLK